MNRSLFAWLSLGPALLIAALLLAYFHAMQPLWLICLSCAMLLSCFIVFACYREIQEQMAKQREIHQKEVIQLQQKLQSVQKQCEVELERNSVQMGLADRVKELEDVCHHLDDEIEHLEQQISKLTLKTKIARVKKSKQAQLELINL
jgi:septal ring factor EnvC (AmiA/AmiB activator)